MIRFLPKGRRGAATGGQFEAPAQRGASSTADVMRFVDPAVLRLAALQVVTPFAASNRRGLAVCGTAPGVGVSFMCLHLAVAFAQAGHRTVLLDADLRSPDANRAFMRDGTGGLLPWLKAGDADGEPYPPMAALGENLWWIPAGGVADDVGELLASERFDALVDRLLRDFDVVIADTPPANLWVDARTVARALGCALIVARRDLSYVDDVSTLDQEFLDDGVTLFGSVLNGV